MQLFIHGTADGIQLPLVFLLHLAEGIVQSAAQIFQLLFVLQGFSALLLPQSAQMFLHRLPLQLKGCFDPAVPLHGLTDRFLLFFQLLGQLFQFAALSQQQYQRHQPDQGAEGQQ